MPQLGACVVNLGCKVNRIESDWFETALSEHGCTLVPQDEADLVVVNTCAVTGEAQAKTRKAVRRAASGSYGPFVAVTGCAANLFADELEAIGPNVRVFASKDELVERALEACAGRGGSSHDVDGFDMPVRQHSVYRARRGVKVQDGCDNECTYCIVWKARGPVRSSDLGVVESQVRRVVAEGAGEVVLSGINLGRFEAVDPDTGGSFGLEGLIDRVCSWGAPLVRISSVEPPDLTEEVALSMARNSDHVAAHLHLPLQSGSDTVLRRMGRHYTTEEFAQTIDTVRRHVPALSLSTDVIVGFPGETEEEFKQTLDFCLRMGFSKIHVFRYSARPGTPAASMNGQVDPMVMKERSEALRDLANELRVQDAMSRVGTEECMLVEYSDEDGWATGTSASYHDCRIELHGRKLSPGVYRVRHESYLAGEGVLVSVTVDSEI